MASLLECPICLKPFTDPRMLSCLHTLCYTCLGDTMVHFGQNGQFQCPVCRKYLQIPEDGADAFPKNFFVNSYMAVVTDTGAGARSKTKLPTQDTSRRNIPCSNSEDGDECTKAEHFCLDCCEHYCKTCSKGHRKSKATRSHAQVGLDDLTDEMLRDATSQSETPRCLKHKDELKLYCSTCKCAICSVCCHVSHQSHTFREIGDVDGDLKLELGELMTTLQRMMEEVKQQTAQNNQSKQRLDTSTSSARETTKDIFQQILHMLNKKAKEIDQKICQINTDGGVELDIQNKNLILHAQLLESLHTFANDLLNRGSVYNRLASLPEVRGRLENFQASPVEDHDGTQASYSVDLVARLLDGLVLEPEAKRGHAGSLAESPLMVKVICFTDQEKV